MLIDIYIYLLFFTSFLFYFSSSQFPLKAQEEQKTAVTWQIWLTQVGFKNDLEKLKHYLQHHV